LILRHIAPFETSAVHMLIAHLSDPYLRPHRHLYQGLIDSNAMFLTAIRHSQGLIRSRI